MGFFSVFGNFVYPPPAAIILNVSTTLNVLVGPCVGWSEANGSNMQYSKFWNSGGQKKGKKPTYVSSRIGMLIAYAPSLLIAASSFLLLPISEGTTRIILVQSSLTLHFFKRILEVMFVHKFSGVAALSTVFPISCSYVAYTSAILYGQSLTLGLPEPAVDLKVAGVALFLVGIAGNLYHHKVLAALRSGGEKEYKIPKGGLFGVVVCPHYLFEMVGFLGISLMSQTWCGFSVVFSMICYLMGRSYNTRKWYLSKFQDFPSHVKSVIPFVF